MKHHWGVGSALGAPLMDVMGAPTRFAGSTFLQLVNTGHVGRVLRFVPTCNLRRQVRNELAVEGA